MADDWIGTIEAAAILGCSRAWVWRLAVQYGKLRYRHVPGRALVVHREDVLRRAEARGRKTEYNSQHSDQQQAQAQSVR